MTVSKATGQIADDVALERILYERRRPLTLAELTEYTGWTKYRVRKSVHRLVTFGTVKREPFQGFVFCPSKSKRG